MNELRLAGCILLDKNGAPLLLHRNTEKYNHWEVPGGKVEPGEADDAAAVRELKEELGIDVRIVHELGHASFEDGRPMTYRWFLATTTDKPNICEPETFDQLAYLTLEELAAPTMSLSKGLQAFINLVNSGKVVL